MPLQKRGVHWFLTDEEVKFIREQLDSMRAKGNYQPGKWFLSGLNKKPEVLGSALPDHMPKKVVLRDITLRTAEQARGVILSAAERLRLLRALVEIGVTSFQVDESLQRHPPEQLREEIKLIKSLNPEAEIELNGVSDEASLGRMADLGANLTAIQGPSNFSVAAFYVGETRKLAWDGKDWRKLVHPPRSLEELVERNKPLINYAKKRGIKIQASLNILHYATEEVVDGFAREMANAGADYISLHDGPGGMTPQAIGYAVTIARKAAPETKIGVHLHNSFSLGVARALAAVQAGANVVECSINGCGNLAGQVDLQTIAAALELFYGVDTGLRLDQFTALRRLGEDVFRFPVACDHAITGDTYFSRPSDLEECVDPLIHATVYPSVFGNTWESHVGGITSDWRMLDKLVALGIPVEKSEVEAIVKEVKAEAIIRKRALTDDEVRAIAMRVKGAA